MCYLLTVLFFFFFFLIKQENYGVVHTRRRLVYFFFYCKNTVQITSQKINKIYITIQKYNIKIDTKQFFQGKHKGHYKEEKHHMKSSDAKASKCHLKFSFKMTNFIKLVYLSSVILLK